MNVTCGSQPALTHRILFGTTNSALQSITVRIGISVLAAVFVICSLSATCQADIFTIDVSADGLIENDGDVDAAANFVITRMSGTVDDRGIFEFDLSSIPDGATINSVQFNGFTRSIASTTNDAVVNLFGYADSTSAQVTSDDYTGGVFVGDLDQSIGELAVDTPFSLTLTDLATFQIALATTDVFGIRSEMTTLNDTWRVDAIEFDTIPASLTINFTAIPEPSSAIAIGLLTIGTLCVRRRRR